MERTYRDWWRNWTHSDGPCSSVGAGGTNYCANSMVRKGRALIIAYLGVAKKNSRPNNKQTKLTRITIPAKHFCKIPGGAQKRRSIRRAEQKHSQSFISGVFLARSVRGMYSAFARSFTVINTTGHVIQGRAIGLPNIIFQGLGSEVQL